MHASGWVVNFYSYFHGRADDFILPGAVTFFKREAHENFLTAPGKFLITVPPIFAYYLGR